MKLSRTVSYALQATLQLAELGAENPVPCSQLAADGKMPDRFLLQILRNLVARGILTSTRGVEGGYALRRSPEEISLLELIEAVQGPLTPGCPDWEDLPHGAGTRLERFLAEITELSRRHLHAVRLSHLLATPSGKRVESKASFPGASAALG